MKVPFRPWVGLHGSRTTLGVQAPLLARGVRSAEEIPPALLWLDSDPPQLLSLLGVVIAPGHPGAMGS